MDFFTEIQWINHKDCYPLSSCKISLKNAHLWKQFHQLETEMIITKSGRRMFPSLHVQAYNLDPRAHYCVLLEMTPTSKSRYKYSAAGGWVAAGAEEAQSINRVYLHPESPGTGEHWMSQPISFGRVKLTNTATPPAGHLVLSSMHKYQPRIVIVKTMDPRAIGWAPSTSIVFPETQFVAVTAYQNEKITKLKIDNNPFAKGFRENGQSKCKRKRHQFEETPDKETKSRAKKQHIESSPGSEDDRISCSSSSPDIFHKEVNSGKPEVSPNFNFHETNSSLYPPLGSRLLVPYYNTPYQFYQPTWHSPYYYPQPFTPMMAHDLTLRNAEVKPKKLTDFSIKAITGIS